MNAQEIEDRSGGLSGVTRSALAERLGVSENALSRVIRGDAIQSYLVPTLLEHDGEFTITGLDFMTELWAVGPGLQGGALGKARSRFVAQSRKDPRFESLYRAYRYAPQSYDVFPVTVVEPDDSGDDEFGSALARFEGNGLAAREIPQLPDLLSGCVADDSPAARLAMAVAAVQYQEVYSRVSGALAQSAKAAVQDATRDHAAALAGQLEARS